MGQLFCNHDPRVSLYVFHFTSINLTQNTLRTPALPSLAYFRIILTSPRPASQIFFLSCRFDCVGEL